MQRGPERVLDEYLVVTAQAGSREAIDQLVRRWTPRLLRHVRHMLGTSDDVPDVLQETWLSAMRGIRGLGDPARFPAWIYAIATRKCADVLRGKFRRRRIAEFLGKEIAAPPASHPLQIEDGLDLHAALNGLPADQRIVVDMFYGADLSVGEIAAALGAPAGTIKSRLFNARQALKTNMEGEVS